MSENRNDDIPQTLQNAEEASSESDIVSVVPQVTDTEGSLGLGSSLVERRSTSFVDPSSRSDYSIAQQEPTSSVNPIVGSGGNQAATGSLSNITSSQQLQEYQQSMSEEGAVGMSNISNPQVAEYLEDVKNSGKRSVRSEISRPGNKHYSYSDKPDWSRPSTSKELSMRKTTTNAGDYVASNIPRPTRMSPIYQSTKWDPTTGSKKRFTLTPPFSSNVRSGFRFFRPNTPTTNYPDSNQRKSTATTSSTIIPSRKFSPSTSFAANYPRTGTTTTSSTAIPSRKYSLSTSSATIPSRKWSPSTSSAVACPRKSTPKASNIASCLKKCTPTTSSTTYPRSSNTFSSTWGTVRGTSTRHEISLPSVIQGTSKDLTERGTDHSDTSNYFIPYPISVNPKEPQNIDDRIRIDYSGHPSAREIQDNPDEPSEYFHRQCASSRPQRDDMQFSQLQQGDPLLTSTSSMPEQNRNKRPEKTPRRPSDLEFRTSGSSGQNPDENAPSERYISPSHSSIFESYQPISEEFRPDSSRHQSPQAIPDNLQSSSIYCPRQVDPGTSTPPKSKTSENKSPVLTKMLASPTLSERELIEKETKKRTERLQGSSKSKLEKSGSSRYSSSGAIPKKRSVPSQQGSTPEQTQSRNDNLQSPSISCSSQVDPGTSTPPKSKANENKSPVLTEMLASPTLSEREEMEKERRKLIKGMLTLPLNLEFGTSRSSGQIPSETTPSERNVLPSHSFTSESQRRMNEGFRLESSRQESSQVISDNLQNPSISHANQGDLGATVTPPEFKDGGSKSSHVPGTISESENIPEGDKTFEHSSSQTGEFPSPSKSTFSPKRSSTTREESLSPKKSRPNVPPHPMSNLSQCPTSHDVPPQSNITQKMKRLQISTEESEEDLKLSPLKKLRIDVDVSPEIQQDVDTPLDLSTSSSSSSQFLGTLPYKFLNLSSEVHLPEEQLEPLNLSLTGTNTYRETGFRTPEIRSRVEIEEPRTTPGTSSHSRARSYVGSEEPPPDERDINLRILAEVASTVASQGSSLGLNIDDPDKEVEDLLRMQDPSTGSTGATSREDLPQPLQSISLIPSSIRTRESTGEQPESSDTSCNRSYEGSPPESSTRATRAEDSKDSRAKSAKK